MPQEKPKKKQKRAQKTKQEATKAKRTKERTISEIIDKVSTWRKLYNGKSDESETRWTLEEAASQVGVSKKSLDDYLLQLRFGKKFGFDFEASMDEKVGILRLFVKQEKDKIKGGQKGIKISSKSDKPQ